MNHVALIGRLTADPEIRTTQNNVTVAHYTLAVDRWGKDEADFIPCVAFSKPAEFAEKHLQKGMKVAVEGRLQSDRYTDKNGNARTSYTVVVASHYFCESKKAEPKEVVDFVAAVNDPGLPWN